MLQAQGHGSTAFREPEITHLLKPPWSRGGVEATQLCTQGFNNQDKARIPQCIPGGQICSPVLCVCEVPLARPDRCARQVDGQHGQRCLAG